MANTNEKFYERRDFIFVIELICLLFLLTLGLFYFVKPNWFCFLSKCFGPIPLGVPWYGALGAVLMGLSGVFEHSASWDANYALWHIGRPFVGASLAVISVLIFQVGVLSVDLNPNAQSSTIQAPSNPTTQPSNGSIAQDQTNSRTQMSTNPTDQYRNNLLFYLIAFLVGYREQTFREMIKRLTDVILGPGGNAVGASPVISSVTPSTAPHGQALPEITISGSGFGKTSSVRFGNIPAKIQNVSDVQLTITVPTASGAPGTANASAGTVPLTVTTPNGSATFSFTLT